MPQHGHPLEDEQDIEPASNLGPVRRPSDLSVYLVLAFLGAMAMLGLIAGGCSAIEGARDKAGDAAEVVKDAGKVAQPLGYVYRFEHPKGPHICSAVAVSPTELFVAAHCIMGDQSPTEPYRVRHLLGGSKAVMVVDVFDGSDLALVQLVNAFDPATGKAGDRLPLYAKIAPNPPAFGDPVVSIGWGCLKGEAPMTSPGLVTFVPGDGSITAGIKVCKGDSGGGLFNRGGELLGVTSMTAEAGGLPAGIFVQVAGKF